jgi:hypothetical protein
MAHRKTRNKKLEARSSNLEIRRLPTKSETKMRLKDKPDPEDPGWIDPHPPRSVGSILGEMSFTPTCEAPEVRQQACALCDCRFVSRPQWFGSKWHCPNICLHCGDNYSHREELRNAKRPRTELIDNPGPKKFVCCGCHKILTITAVKDGLYWLYKGPCQHCGTYFENLYYAYKAKPKPEKESRSQDKSLDDID